MARKKAGGRSFTLNLRTQVLKQNERGWNEWRILSARKVVPAGRMAVLLCDVWDDHCSRAAAERLNEMVPRMNEVVKAARSRGAVIVHAPSDTMDFYAKHPARRRIVEAPKAAVPQGGHHYDPPLPVSAERGGSDSGEKVGYKAWTKQHPGIGIDPARDVISDNGPEIYGYLRRRGVEDLAIMGVHTNMCVLHRSFGIKNMVKMWMGMYLVRDLTDPMYDPAEPPYVSHDEGTRLVIEYIEKFWCPSILSEDLT